MRRNIFVVIICFLLAGSVFAQKSKPWSEWSKKDADKMLNDSAWGQSQTKGETQPTVGKLNEGRNTSDSGPSEVTLPTDYHIRIRLISAKPIREGFARKLVLSQPDKGKELTDQFQPIIDKGFGDFIIVAVNFDAQNSRISAEYLQGLARLTTAFLSGKAYLERKDGKRLELVEYRPPVADDMGGKFIFARTLDAAPFLSPDSDSVRFVLNVSDKLKLDAKFKVSAMMYGDRLEY